MISIKDVAQCCGCGGCANVCPVGCITMKRDNEGFLYPEVDRSRCAQCGRCEQVCPMLRSKAGAEALRPGWEKPLAMGGWNKDQEVRRMSSSGGVFTLLAGEIIRRNGIVFGAVMNGLRVEHASAESMEGLAAMRGSKYVQSDLGDAYRQVRDVLKSGRPVLFTGTPCQTAGLKTFLGKPCENLYLLDFVCHGVPSPKMLEQYLDSVERGRNAKIVSFSFRGKEKGWFSKGSRLQMGPRAEFSDGSERHVYPAIRDSYINGFLEDYDLRPSCYECPFKGIPKWTADITLADFWGVDGVLPEMNDGKGTSLLLLHTERGKELFDAIKGDFEYRECDWEKATENNPSLTHSSKRPPLRDCIFEELEADGYDRVARRHLSAAKVVAKRLSKAVGAVLERIVQLGASIICKVLHLGNSEASREKVAQFIRFCMVGITNVVVAYTTNIATLLLVGALFPGFEWDYVVANVVAFLVSVYWSFYWNSRKVFHFDTRDRAARRRALFKSYICYGFTGIVLNNVLSTIWIRGLGISKLISPLMNLMFTIPLNYIFNKTWAFADRSSAGKGKKRKA